MLSDEQFQRVQRLASRLAGIELVARHRELLERRGRRASLETNEWESFLSATEAGEPGAVQRFLCLLTTKFTSFFRHPRHFELAAQHAVGAIEKRGRARLWSAAAATGEEPWSLAMAVIAALGNEAPVNILATDVDVAALAVAQRGEYAEPAMSGVSPEHRTRFFKPSLAPGVFAVGPEVRRFVEFRPLNLADVAWPVTGPLDVIFCRNVLMYFETSHRYAVLERMASLLAPEGLLLIDPTEHLGAAETWFAPKASGVYARRPIAAAPGCGLKRDSLAGVGNY